jgi:MoaA/NifB/PqqE/SkfB family radical SAM enzyme
MSNHQSNKENNTDGNTMKPMDSNHSPKQQIVNGWKKRWVFIRLWCDIAITIWRKKRNIRAVIADIRVLMSVRNDMTHQNTFPKLAFVDGKYFMSSNMNGWPSKHFHRTIDIEIRSRKQEKMSRLEQLRGVQIAFTKKCPLNCEHCYEGDILNLKDTLTLDDHRKILQKIQQVGISIIQFGGGDPMAKVDDIVSLLEGAEKTADFWMYTSGYKFNEKNAFRLKKAGLTGVSLGLDHYEREKHNAFRRNDKAYDWVLEGAEAAKKAKLVLTLTVCVTREFCSETHLMNYMLLAKELGASFVQLLEPRAEGNYAGKDVMLSLDELQLIHEFFIKINNWKAFEDYPIILYNGFIQRKAGCPGAGSRFIFIDTDGNMNACPFCRNSKVPFLSLDHESGLQQISKEGCDLVQSLINDPAPKEVEKELVD